MKEKDVRDRINAFLRNRLQNLVVPASMGIGLALGACDTSALKANSDSSWDSSAIFTGNGGTIYGVGGFPNPGSGGAGGGLTGGRFNMLAEEPTAEEKSYFDSGMPVR